MYFPVNFFYQIWSVLSNSYGVLSLDLSTSQLSKVNEFYSYTFIKNGQLIYYHK